MRQGRAVVRGTKEERRAPRGREEEESRTVYEEGQECKAVKR